MNKEKNLTVCILAAGLGSRMGTYSEVTNKALLPINKKAVLTHLIEKFHKSTEFVFALGYKEELVKEYLTLAHPQTNYQTVHVDNYDQKGSGPGYSLLCCQNHLQKPFIFLSCDTLWSDHINFDMSENWFAVANIPADQSKNYCNFEINNGKIIKIHDKKSVIGAKYRAFTGLCYIKDFTEFWKSLAQKKTITQDELQISDGILGLLHKNPRALELAWQDIGTIEKYQNVVKLHENFDFSKTDEFFYSLDDKVIKFFKDPIIVQNRVKKTEINAKVFPEILGHNKHFFSYQYFSGNTLYETDNLSDVFKSLLDWLTHNLWNPVAINKSDIQATCLNFYHKKTMTRLAQFKKKYPNHEINQINGTSVIAIDLLLNQVPWENLTNGLAYFIHGDLQFDNILYNQKQKTFKLLDWRQDFDGNPNWGDIHYDFAKILGGIELNYQKIKLGLFDYSEQHQKSKIQYESVTNKADCILTLKKMLSTKGIQYNKVAILTGLIYLNMAPLHHPPFDKFLYSLGKLKLTNALGDSSND